MKDGLLIDDGNKITPIVNINTLTQAYQIECAKSARRKRIRQLASHLSMVFCINPNEQTLVITLCDGSANNNLEALKCWLDMMLTEENSVAKIEFWENALAGVLSEICRSI